VIELNFPNAVREEKDFYGRRPALERIERVFCSGTRRPVAVYGERRMGKTSMMNVVAARLRTLESPRVVALFPATIGVCSLEDLLREILQSLCEFQGTSLTERGLVGDDRQFHLNSLGHFHGEARALLQGSPAALHVLCIDEFDALVHNCLSFGQPGEAHKVLGFASGLVEQTDLPVTFFLTLTRLPDPVQDAFNTFVTEGAERINLAPLSPSEIGELLDRVLGGALTLKEPQRRQLEDLCGGHPYVLKLLLANLLDRVWERTFPVQVDGALLEQAVNAAAQDPRAEHALGNILRMHFSPQERDLVTLMAAMNDTVTRQQLDRVGKTWHTVAENLVRRGYLAPGPPDAAYTFRLAFLGHWLRQRPVFEEHLARLDGVRQEMAQEKGADSVVEIEIDAERRRVLVRDDEVHLTRQEYDTLWYLCQAGGRLVTKDDLAQHLWPQSTGGVGDAAIDAVVYRLRRKIGDDARDPRYLETVVGHGFILHRAAFVVDPAAR